MKAVLLHDGNKQRPIPLAHAVHMKDTYVNIQGLLGEYIQSDTKKTGTFEKNQQKLKKSKKKYLLTEIEPLQLPF